MNQAIWVTFLVFAALMLGSLGAASSLAQHPVDEDAAKTTKRELDRKLGDYLTGTRWRGHFTITGKDTPPNEEQYEIIKAEKAGKGDYWNLVARIKYGEHDITQPLPPIEIKWAGRTPLITVDKVNVPGLGVFDARVVIRKGSHGKPGKYAGTWSHDDVGGHLFGTIEKVDSGSSDQAVPSPKNGDQKNGAQSGSSGSQ